MESIATTPYFKLQISGNNISKLLDKIYPYLIAKRQQAKLICEFQNHISRRGGSRIDEVEQIFRDEDLEMIEKANFSNEVNLDHVINGYLLISSDFSIQKRK